MTFSDTKGESMTATRTDRLVDQGTSTERWERVVTNGRGDIRHTITSPNSFDPAQATWMMTIARSDAVEEIDAQFWIWIAYYQRWYGVGGVVTTEFTTDQWVMMVDGVIRAAITKEMTTQGGILTLRISDLPDNLEYLNVFTLTWDIAVVMQLARLGGSPDVKPDPNAHPDETRVDEFPYLPSSAFVEDAPPMPPDAQ